ncbi:6-carboxyhexanoate-CoA ligase [Propionispora sp. 2/2-37]|uniref:6-carboxyhexanoate--CoA ligase n=1 Tax=Propionispora sp. 2/2-37 TaxID=1677858 RepID=UPI0006BB6D06|nr:6-carboxyhexanoate--CoA ligase [Propionispora sp. 2/2-37]CUH96819.1 6-carboxyhexanoate-CoA ligase [Propionispora sp. 2/2-37]
MLFSVRMRAAQGGAHEVGGKHISGAERLVKKECLSTLAAYMLERALTHSRGEADFINITVEAVACSAIRKIKCLAIQTVAVDHIAAGRAAAREKLIQAGVTRQAAAKGLELLTGLTHSLRGAMLVCAATGKRLDKTGERGVRVSRMDVEDEQAYHHWLSRQGYQNIHIKEALVLASKVSSAPGIRAELCWSDDPEYITGYVASPAGYTRITHLKPFGSEVGGRIFFVAPNAAVDEITAYLENQPVLVQVAESEGSSDAFSD